MSKWGKRTDKRVSVIWSGVEIFWFWIEWSVLNGVVFFCSSTFPILFFHFFHLEQPTHSFGHKSLLDLLICECRNSKLKRILSQCYVLPYCWSLNPTNHAVSAPQADYAILGVGNDPKSIFAAQCLWDHRQKLINRSKLCQFDDEIKSW